MKICFKAYASKEYQRCQSQRVRLGVRGMASTIITTHPCNIPTRSRMQNAEAGI